MDFGKTFAYSIIALFSIAILSNVLYGIQLDKQNTPTGYVIVDQVDTGCIDTDGDRVYKAGATTAFGSTVADFCVDEKTIKEFYCEGDLRTSKESTCPFGCSNGACK